MRNRKQCILLCGMIAVLVFTMAGCKNPFLAELKEKGEKEAKPQTETTFTVTFNSNDGSTVAAKTGIPSGSTITLPSNPMKNRRAFAGWFTDDESFANPFTASTPVTADIIVYAKWVELQPIESSFLSTLKLVPVYAGTFTMGQENIATPVHEVTLTKNFYMGRTEVTQAQYLAVMGSYPGTGTNVPVPSSTYGAGDNYPMYYVNWNDAIAFCNALSLKEGLTPTYTVSGSNVTWNKNANGYRLPTEAEWEYACRAGTTTIYNTGDTISYDTGWYRDNSDGKTHEVGTKPANAWGLYDMHGNVWEWCWDRYGSYSSGTQTDPAGATSGTDRVRRGGYWGGGAEYLRSVYRSRSVPNYRGSNHGFRLVRPQV